MLGSIAAVVLGSTEDRGTVSFGVSVVTSIGSNVGFSVSAAVVSSLVCSVVTLISPPPTVVSCSSSDTHVKLGVPTSPGHTTSINTLPAHALLSPLP